MIAPLSLFPLSGALLSTALAATTLLLGHRVMDRLRWSFIGLNVSVAAWCTGSAIQLNATGGVPYGATTFGTMEYWVFVGVVAGLAGSSTYFFFFAAAFTGRGKPFSWPIAMAAHVPLVGSVIAVMTNPTHGLYAVPGGDGSVGYGILMPPLFLGMYALMISGIVFMLRFPLGGRAARQHARVAAGAAVLSTLTGLAWNLRGVLNLDLGLNPSPTASALFSAVLAWLVFSEGLGQIVPSVASMAFRHASDVAIAADERLRILALNDAAAELFPHVSDGDDMNDVMPDIAKHVAECARGHERADAFEVVIDGKTFVGRSRVTSPGSRPSGCVVLLTDVSVLRQAEQALADIEEDIHDGGVQPSRWAR